MFTFQKSTAGVHFFSLCNNLYSSSNVGHQNVSQTMPKGAVFSVPFAQLALFIPDLNVGVIQNGRRFLENKKIKTREKKE